MIHEQTKEEATRDDRARGWDGCLADLALLAVQEADRS